MKRDAIPIAELKLALETFEEEALKSKQKVADQEAASFEDAISQSGEMSLYTGMIAAFNMVKQYIEMSL